MQRVEHVQLKLVRPGFPDFSHLGKSDLDFQRWSQAIHETIDFDKFQRLWGGYSNFVVKENAHDIVWVYWREAHRWPELLRAITIENIMSTKFGIQGRTLVDEQRPFEIINGHLVTRFNYVQGDNVYPWQDREIVRASHLQAKLHRALRFVSFDPEQKKPSSPKNQLIHRDFDRGNLLFGLTEQPAVIDYERLEYGSVEEDMGKTLSFILVDSKLGEMEYATVLTSKLADLFARRFYLYIGNYEDHFEQKQIVNWAIKFLQFDDYGSLNIVRDRAVEWLSRLSSQ